MKSYLIVVLSMLTMALGCAKSVETSETSDESSGVCSLDDNTTETATVNTYGCAILTRDTSSCQSARTAQGLSGFWLKFSCRVTLTKSGSNVIINFDSRPDSRSQYFGSSNACYEAFSYSGRFTNPNLISAQSITMTVPYAPSTTTNSSTSLGVIGAAINGASIYNNAAAPGDSIYDEVASFDKCEGHPDHDGVYHQHIEPASITNNDSAFVGVLRDGFPVYGRKCYDGSTPSLDSAGGHTSMTLDGTSMYHYHIHQQTSGSDSAYFISSGYYKGTAGSCSGC